MGTIKRTNSAASTPEKNVYIIEKIESGFAKKTGMLGRARSYELKYDEDRNETVPEFSGDFDKVKFPESKEDLAPLYINRKWQFKGDNATLTELVKQIGLTYPIGHPKEGDIITEANINNEIDPFFSHKHWREGALFTMIGGKQVVRDDDPEFKFLLLCLQGGNMTTTDGDLYEAAGSKFRIVKSNADTKADVSDSITEMELSAAILNLTGEEAALIAIILGLVLNESSVVDTNSIKSNLLTNLKRKDKNPNGDVKFFEGRTYKDAFNDLIGNDLAELNKKANIKKAYAKNILRYRDDSYELKGKKLNATTFSQLVTYFKSEEGLDDYNKLKDALDA